MDFKLTRWPMNGIGLEYGPLVFSLKIKENWLVDKQDKRSTKEFPAWNLYAASRWNYALALDKKQPWKNIQIIKRSFNNNPWSIDTAPIELKVPARLVNGWVIDHKTKTDCEGLVDGKIGMKIITGDFRFTPQLPDPKTLNRKLSKTVDTVTLVPYGSTKLRVTVFPDGSKILKKH
jgi:hypothetical protein